MEQRGIRQIMKDYFSFTRSERRGMMVLCIILAFSVGVNLFSGKIRPGKPADRSEFIQLMQLMEQSAEEVPVQGMKLFAFDPNRITEGELDSLDLPAAVKRNLFRYRQKGGSFRRAADFGKLYGMNDSLMAVVMPYLVVRTTERHEYEAKPEYARNKFRATDDGKVDQAMQQFVSREKVIGIVELNSADSVMLLTLPGIGPAFAGRIIRYRNILGGYFSPHQLMEVYGMTQERMAQFLPYVIADTVLIRNIRLNFADTRMLARHPYLGREQASRIIDFRSANGPFTSPRQLLDHQLVDSGSFHKVIPYLTCR